MLEAAESLPTVPATVAPEAGTFWSAQHAPGSLEPWPAMPANIRGVPLWDMGGGVYLLDDLQVNYNQPVKSKTTAKTAGGMEEMVDLNPGDGDTNDDDGGGYTNNFQIAPIDTNGLWLQITNVSGDLAYLNLMNATDLVYEIWSKTNLLDAGWNIEEELWPAGSQTNVMPFALPVLDRTNNLFIWARDWTRVDENSNSIPDWWEWNYFGNFSQPTNESYDGINTILYDYQNGIDPNTIQFSLQFTNTYLNANPAYGAVTISGGVPSYEAVLINDTNFEDASWQPYTSTNVAVFLNSGNGTYHVLVGLRGLPSEAAQTWMGTQLTLNTIVPALSVTNPTSGSVSVPMIQLQGIVSESLSKLTYDVSNAAGIFTNQTGYLTGQSYDTTLLEFTTNYFQCYDVAMTNGVNVITLHATDLAGNTTTTNFSYTLSYAGVTNAPTLSLIWPQNNALISGGSYTIQAQVSDATATVTATVNGNIVQGLVERNGQVWLQNVPLSGGTNVVTIIAANAAGKSSTNSLNVVQSTVNLTIDPIGDDQLNQPAVSVTGTVDDESYTVWVNGVEVYYIDDDGDWEADGVPVNATGMAVVTVEVDDPIAGQSLVFEQPSVVQVSGYQENEQYADIIYNYCDGSQNTGGSAQTGNWTLGIGGFTWDSAGGQSDWPAGDPPVPPWSYAAVDQSISEYLADDENGCKGSGMAYYTTKNITQTVLELVASGSAQGAVQKLIRLTMSAALDDGTPVSPATNPFHILGQTLTPTATNAYVGETFVTQTAGSTQTFAPDVTGAPAYNATVQAQDVPIKIVDANSGADLTLQTNSVIVGQQMNLQCRLSITNSFMKNFPLANFQWTIPGYAISNYVANDNSGVVYTNFSTVNSNVVFYWVDGANNRTIQCSATINGKTITGQATFNVLRPTAKITTQTGSVSVNSTWGDLEISFGLQSPEIAGITFSNIITMPSTNFTGSTEWLQVVNDVVQTRQRISDLVWETWAGGGGLDNSVPYDNEPLNTLTVNDNPGGHLTNDYLEYNVVTNSFTMWLLFKPDINNACFVPLRAVGWNWSGSATNNVGTWMLESGATNSVNPPDFGTTGFPLWNRNVTNNVWQVE
jgi:hypothetical protein